MKLYEQTSKHYFEELGVTPSEKLVSSTVSGKPHGQQAPRDRRGTGRSSGEPGRKGRSILLFPRRIPVTATDLFTVCPELNGQMPWLMLCTITDGKGYPAKGGPRL